jgi:hypothetical protein
MSHLKVYAVRPNSFTEEMQLGLLSLIPIVVHVRRDKGILFVRYTTACLTTMMLFLIGCPVHSDQRTWRRGSNDSVPNQFCTVSVQYTFYVGRLSRVRFC